MSHSATVVRASLVGVFSLIRIRKLENDHNLWEGKINLVLSLLRETRLTRIVKEVKSDQQIGREAGIIISKCDNLF
jgi:hypothetical protein